MNKSSLSLLKMFLICSLLFISASAYAIDSNLIVGFEVEGNRMIKEKIILLNVSLKVGDVVEPEAVQKEIARLGEMGYFSYVGAEIRSKGKGKVLVFKVEENAILSEVSISGCTKVKPADLREAMESKIGSVFNSKLLTQDIQNLNEALARRGYLFSKVSDAYVQDQGSKINVEITEGIISEVKIEGLKKTKERVVRRELTLKTGEIYNNKVIVRDLQRIYNLGFFEEVKREHLPGKTPEEIVLVIQLVEQKTGRAGVGAGYSSLNGLVGFVNLSQNNFRGEGKRIYMKTEFGGVRTYEVGYFDPWFRGRPQSFGIDLYNTQYVRDLYSAGNTLTEYDESRKGGSISFGKRIRRDIDVSLRFSDEDVDLKPTDSTATAPAGVANGRLQTLSLVLDKDTRDNRFSPTAGAHDSFMIQSTGGILKGANQYAKYVLSLRRYFAITKNRKTVFAVQAVGGGTSVGEGFVPVYDMFSVGGSHTVRGYEEREFLGTKVFYGNLEIRHKFAKKFSVVGFYDLGSAWGTDYNRKPISMDMKQGFGVGIRLVTPLGPVAIDYGKATDRDDGNTYINFGSSF